MLSHGLDPMKVTGAHGPVYVLSLFTFLISAVHTGQPSSTEPVELAYTSSP